jgi:hypothetical protein
MAQARTWLESRGALAAYEQDRAERFARFVRCPDWCEQGDHAEDRSNLLDSVQHHKVIGSRGEITVMLGAYQTYAGEDAGHVYPSSLAVDGITDGEITDPDAARALAALLPAAADALADALAAHDKITGAS